MIIGKILDSLGETARNMSDKATRAYRDTVGEELLKQQDDLNKSQDAIRALEGQLKEQQRALEQREAALKEQQKVLEQREAALKKYYFVPKFATKVALILLVIGGVYYVNAHPLLFFLLGL